MKHLVKWIYRLRIPIIACTVLTTVFFGYQLRYLRINSDVLSYLPSTDPAVKLYKDIGSTFGGNKMVLIAVKDTNIFSAAAMARVDTLTSALKEIPGISTVSSLADVIDIRKASDGGIEIDKLINPENPPQTQEQYDSLRAYTLGKELYNGRLVSADGRAALVLAQIVDSADDMKVAVEVKKTVARMSFGASAFSGGIPIVLRQLTDSIFSDLIYLIPIVSLLIIVTLLFSFGTVRGVVIPLMSVGISTVWILGLMSMLRVPLTIISDIIPVLLIAIGTAPCIHILSKFDEAPQERYGNTGEEAQKAYREVGIRVILAAVTIIFGFTSFIFGSYLTMIREFGIFCSIGVFFSLLISFFFVPAVLSFLKVKQPRKHPESKSARNTPVTRAMERLGGFVVGHEIPVALCGLAVMLVGLAGAPRIERRVDMIDYFKPSSTTSVSEKVLDKQFGGSRPIHIRFTGDLQDPFVLKEMIRLEKFLKSMQTIHNPLSIADLIAQMNDIMGEGKGIPGSRDKVTNLFFLLQGQEIASRLINEDKDTGIVTSMVGVLDVNKMRQIVDGVQEYVEHIDTNFVTIPLSVMNKALADRIRELRFERAIQAIEREFRARYIDNVPGEGKVREILESGLYGTGRDSISAARAGDAAVRIMSMLPEPVKNNRNLKSDLEGDIVELSETAAAVPAELLKELQPALLQTASSTVFNVAHTGMPMIYKHLDDSLVESQIQSFIIALIFIFLLLSIQLRSVKAGLLGLIPIVLTVVLMFGIMGYSGIPIDVATVLVASIALGIGIDYSIHFSVRFKTYYNGPGSVRGALNETLRTTGKAIIINVLAVTMGFVTLFFADLVPLQRFGILVAITMIGSGAGALTLLPALMILTKLEFRSTNVNKAVRKEEVCAE